ncbi:MAG: CDP-glycerol--glycerophosphate glycerophosphotransferase [Lachnospiraceae bacterium]|nr:CDP-glycerol--glycerophosphate glycerophosphotransferase [Lachnospiraceae bacterium]
MILYIDPGTGSMLFTILIGVIGTAVYSLRMLFIKIHFKLTGGKVTVNQNKIPFVIFSDNKRYWSVFEPICREMDRRGKDILYITASPDDPVLECPYSHVTAECIENNNKLFTRLNFLNATIVLSTTPGLEVYQWKRSPDVEYYVHIPHTAGTLILYRMFGIDYYDAVLLSGNFQERDVRNLEKLRSLPEKELVKVGIPYMDEMAKRIEKSGLAFEHERTVLLAPSWGSSAIFAVYGGRIIEVLLKTGYHVIVRPHPQSLTSEKNMIEKLMEEYPEQEKLEWNRDTDNFEVLRRADILISDFSGVVFEFALVYDKPIIYTNPDFNLDPYDAWWLDNPVLTTTAFFPKLGCELNEDNMESLKELIDSCIDDEKYAEGRCEVKKEAWAYFGEGCSRTVDYLVKKYEEITACDKEEKGIS